MRALDDLGKACMRSSRGDRSSETHTVKRQGFALTHANFLTSTASQGQTIRTGATIDCARLPPQGARGTQDSDWWLHLYVLFSRVTCMADMLLLRPPPRELLEAGPPAEELLEPGQGINAQLILPDRKLVPIDTVVLLAAVWPSPFKCVAASSA